MNIAEKIFRSVQWIAILQIFRSITFTIVEDIEIKDLEAGAKESKQDHIVAMIKGTVLAMESCARCNSESGHIKSRQAKKWWKN